MRPEMLRHVNQKRVLDALRTRSPQSRVGLAERLGLTRSTLTVIVSTLVEQGLVRDAEVDVPRARTGGRPRVGLELVNDGAYFAGADIGHKTITAIVVDLLGEEVARAQATAPESAQSAERTAGTLLRQALATVPRAAERLRGIGVTVPGVVFGDVLERPKHGWRGIRFGREVAAEFDVPVLVENDANACAISESLAAAGSSSRDVLYLLLEHRGVGAGMLANGQIGRGFAGRAGEVGHIRVPTSLATVPEGPAPSVEEILAVEGVVASMRARTGDTADWPGFLAALDAGQPDAVAVAHEWQHLLGWLTATLALTVAPEVVVFGGPLAVVLEADRRSFQRSLHVHGVSWELPIEISRHGADATAMGAAALPRASFFSLPMLRPEYASPAPSLTG